MLVLLYAFVRRFIGKREALIALLVVASDDWILFTNQGIYLEDSQMILILCAMWTYWRATQSDLTKGKQVLMHYLLAGVLVGVVIDYKQIGGFVVVSILINFALQRQQWKPHLLLLVVATSMFILYLVAMHLVFGQLFDSATLTQLTRTAGTRSSAGLTYSPLTAIQAIVSIYWIFPTTILTLIGGSLLVTWRGFQYLRGKRKGENTVLLSWAAGGIVFAMSISLKSPHYMLLWLIPLYLFLVQEGSHIHTHIFRRGRNSALVFLTLLQIILAVNLWSFQMRFMNIPGDVIIESNAYINTHIPSSALVAEQDYLAVGSTPKYVNIAFIQTPKELYYSHARYVAFYWSTTEPIPASLGDTRKYCTPMATFTGFKDHIEVCQVNRTYLSSLYAARLPE